MSTIKKWNYLMRRIKQSRRNIYLTLKQIGKLFGNINKSPRWAEFWQNAEWQKEPFLLCLLWNKKIIIQYLKGGEKPLPPLLRGHLKFYFFKKISISVEGDKISMKKNDTKNKELPAHSDFLFCRLASKVRVPEPAFLQLSLLNQVFYFVVLSPHLGS